MNISERTNPKPNIDNTNTKVLICTCFHITQDNAYGIYKRLHVRVSGKGNGTLWRCQGCGQERFERVKVEEVFPKIALDSMSAVMKVAREISKKKKPDVVIEVLGGIAYVIKCPDGIIVEITDHDGRLENFDA